MASLSLKHIYKVYDGGVKAVNDFCMEIEDKEFIVFVGPSGCGKSTTLRMIAGLEDITAGELRIDDDIVNDCEPKDRNIAMVFQNYALYPHMSVYENLAFSLKTMKMPKDEIHEKVMEAARILGITEYLERKPKALSGGQRQRVALGRAIVRNPKVFLLDEPLSNLDAKLRAAMRAEISRLHERLQTTFIYVTHDQVEAMTMGTRIVVMKAGFVQQIDTPQNLYRYPGNMFVAGFIGTPQMNFFDGVITKRGNDVTFMLDCGADIKMDYSMANKILVKYMNGEHKVVVGVRPDDVKLDSDLYSDDEWEKMKAVVSVVEALGGETLIYANLNLQTPDAQLGAITVKADADCSVRRGDIINIAINKNKLHVFDKETEDSIKPRIPGENVVDCSVKGGKLSFAGQTFTLPSALECNDSTSEAVIPTDAVILGAGEGMATVAQVEYIENKTLYRLDVNGTTMFALQNDEPTYAEGQDVKFGIDYCRISIEGCGISPLESTNCISGKFVKIKEADENGKKRYNFYMNFDSSSQMLSAPNKMSKKLFACKGAKIFHTPVEYIFNAQDVLVSFGNGSPKSSLNGTVERIMDYGDIKYAVINVDNNKITAPYDGSEGDSVNIKIKPDAITVKDKQLDIIIV